MRRKLLAPAIITGVLAMSVAAGGAASAVTADPYTPDTPETASLTGSTVVSYCAGDSPHLRYDVQLTDPAGIVTAKTAYLTLSTDTDSVEIALGDLVDGALSGSMAWPGLGGDTTDVTATLRVNPTLSLPISLPSCTVASTTGLASTGGGISWISLGVGLAAAGAGATALAISRRRAHR